jgi:hypothetical protein
MVCAVRQITAKEIKWDCLIKTLKKLKIKYDFEINFAQRLWPQNNCIKNTQQLKENNFDYWRKK